MTAKGIVTTCLAFTLVVALDASAQEMAWTYGDLRYLTGTPDRDTDGYTVELSGNVSRNWVLQTRFNQLFLDEDQFDVTQTRYDVNAGWILRMGDHLNWLFSGGYSHLKVKTDFNDFGSTSSSDHMLNGQASVRAGLGPLELDGTVGILVDDEDTSDILWSGGVRYQMGPSVSVHVGLYGSLDDLAPDDLMYELGFRFDLRPPR